VILCLLVLCVQGKGYSQKCAWCAYCRGWRLVISVAVMEGCKLWLLAGASQWVALPHLLIRFCQNLHLSGAFGKMQKATTSFVTSVCPSVRATVCPHVTTRLLLDIFS
jgi:hypothetical protein